MMLSFNRLAEVARHVLVVDERLVALLQIGNGLPALARRPIFTVSAF